jgi:hypothetical protein
MRHKIITTLEAILAITGLGSVVHPQLAVASPRNSSLKIESRTIEDDYKLFFQNKQNTSFNRFGNTQDYDTFADGDDGVWRINDEVRFLVNEPLVEQNNILNPPRRDFYEGIDRVEVRSNLLE